ncbi:hypothetical protein ACWDTI_18160 [Gordonia sp. NPDC003424]
MSTTSSEDNDVALTQSGEPTGRRKWKYRKPSKRALSGAFVILTAASVSMGLTAQPAQAGIFDNIGQSITDSLNNINTAIADANNHLQNVSQGIHDAATGGGIVVVPTTTPTQPPLSLLDQFAQNAQDAQAFRDSVSEIQKAMNGAGTFDLNDVITQVINGAGAQLADEFRIEIAGPGGANGGADGTQSTGTGIAIVSPGTIDVIPASSYKTIGDFYTILQKGWNLSASALGRDPLPDLRQPAQADGTATISGDAYHVAFATTGGNAFAHSSSNGLATAGASDGRTAYALSIGGMAHAWNTDPVGATILGNSPSSYPTGSLGGIGITIPDPTVLPGVKQVDAVGGISFAYAQDVGAAFNLGGVFDSSVSVYPDRSLQLALTDPTAAIFNPQDVLGTVVSDILAGKSPALTRDFVRFSTDAKTTLALTSGYGFSDSIKVHWLGSTFTFAPLVEVNGQLRPNYLALPQVSSSGEFHLLPTFEIPSFDLPFGLPSIDPQGIGTGAATQTGSTSTPAPAPTVTTRAALLPEAFGATDSVRADEPDTSGTAGSVPVVSAPETATAPAATVTAAPSVATTTDSTSGTVTSNEAVSSTDSTSADSTSTGSTSTDSTSADSTSTGSTSTRLTSTSSSGSSVSS